MAALSAAPGSGPRWGMINMKRWEQPLFRTHACQTLGPSVYEGKESVSQLGSGLPQRATPPTRPELGQPHRPLLCQQRLRERCLSIMATGLFTPPLHSALRSPVASKLGLYRRRTWPSPSHCCLGVATTKAQLTAQASCRLAHRPWQLAV